MTPAETLAAVRALVAELGALEATATKGEWLGAPGNFITAGCHNSDPETGHIVAEVPCQGANDNDLPFIVALRNALPRLRALVGEP